MEGYMRIRVTLFGCNASRPYNIIILKVTIILYMFLILLLFICQYFAEFLHHTNVSHYPHAAQKYNLKINIKISLNNSRLIPL